ncbi:MAG TPA: hypothetical protein VKB69_08665, partial [Micromonosporaceae bacterium]|nr:hypothetical protein [Micromonosporaceae bacterium]
MSAPKMREPGANGQGPAGNGSGPAGNGSAPAGAKPAGGTPAVLDARSNAASRPQGGRFGPAMMFGGPAAKALNFKSSGKRMLRMLAPQKPI